MGAQSLTDSNSQGGHLYSVLNLPKDASQAEINERHRSLSLLFHPDKQTDTKLKESANKEFLDIQKAYQVLSDPFLRQVYDTLGYDGLAMKWSPEIRSRTKEEIQDILNQGWLDLTKHRLRQSVLPKAKISCSLNASPLFSPKINSFRGRWISRIRERIRATYALSQSLGYSVEKKVSEKTSLSIEAQSTLDVKKASISFLGAVRHQFSPRVVTLTTFSFSHPYVTRFEVKYEDPDDALNFKTTFSPLYLNTLPPTTLSISRRLFRSRPQKGKISLRIAKQPSISFFFISPPTLDLNEEDGSSPQFGPPTTLGLKHVAFEKNIGLTFDDIFPRLVAETSLTFIELSTRLKASMQLSFTTGVLYSLGAHWSNETTEVSSAIVLNATSLLLQIDCSYLDQQISLPILLATDSSPLLVLGTIVVPSTLTLLGYHFFVLPRRRVQRKAHIQSARKEFEEDYESRRQRNAVEALLKDAARKQMRQEAERGGLVIQEAAYGPEEVELDGPEESVLLDVTIPVQALVRKSQLHIPGGDSKAALQGFSDPAPFAAKSLRIRYSFRGRQHYAEIPDYMPVVLPLAEHQVNGGEMETKTSSEISSPPKAGSEGQGTSELRCPSD
ncbi:hypothetical protein CPB84DRAFT_1779906 [Gymnopilus junonius]|uniref:J domain-containing protein n=1 Tax=Gymnopilus junonius TaxID=109634 RepID=A0A9P5NM13_GYMJU|nr:hypothetical protein CPB84DRAFT_1779906 [Gymnopilus junonius]